MTAQRILLVEDDPTIAQAVAERLIVEGFEVATAADGPAGVAVAASFLPDLLVLDVMLPGFDGLEVCRRVQAARPVPVLMLTARDDETDLLVGLGVGADDYVTKPFSMRELVARIRALLRRSAVTAAVAPEKLKIDEAARRVHLEGTEIHLTPMEFDLLACLARNPGTVMTRSVLLEAVWNWAGSSDSRVIDTHVKTLRRKLGASWIRTAHGVGYALERQ
ncbi:response regulator transcription factor [Actinocorallia populi]|uniref:response regulator transcription factor n=1 Tax=Actinocorallia populi TaxID=2079200 RepID=UPI0018E58E36|nr:response regulator transcription factor [Actinocorallia populi]